MPTITATIGGLRSNSYELLTEAATYFDERLALPTPWVASGDNSIRALIMATRVMDVMNVPHRTLRFNERDGQYYYTSRQWTGAPATATQRLAWPRTGMLDRNGNSLDFTVTSISVAAAAVVVTDRAHGRVTGDKVFFLGTNSTPTIDGEQTVTVLSTTSFSVVVTTTVAGSAGSMTFIPQELKDAESEFAGQLLIADTTLDNPVIIQGLTSVKAGSVALTFKDMIESHVLPDAVLNMMPPSWLTDELVEPATPAEFDVISRGSTLRNQRGFC